MLLDPVVVAIDAVAPDVGLLGDKVPGDEAEGHFGRQSVRGAQAWLLGLRRGWGVGGGDPDGDRAGRDIMEAWKIYRVEISF